MANLNSFSVSARHLRVVQDQNPFLADSLLADCNYDLNEVAAVIGPLLDAPNRCRVTSLYIQAVATERTAFLATNLLRQQPTQLTSIASSWLIGRSPACAIAVKHNTVSRCHALIGRHPIKGLYITDIGSSNGTWVNRHRLMPTEQKLLQDGDLLQLGKLQIEFFLSSQRHLSFCREQSTRSSRTSRAGQK